MKIAISIKEKLADSEIDPRFGRCQYFAIYDTESDQIQLVDNPGAQASSGAGIETAGFIANQDIQAVVTGNVGPNAYTTLDAGDVDIFAGISGTVPEAIQKYKSNNLVSVKAATVESHHGTKAESSIKDATETLVAVTADSDAGLEAPVAAHFGRCPYYTLVTLKDGRIIGDKAIANPFYNAHQPGQVPEFINNQNADIMISGGMGAKAVQFFADFGIEAVTGASGTVKQATEAYLNGQLTGTAPCSGEHNGCS